MRSLDIDACMESFMPYLEANRRTTNTVFHVSLNPSPEDKLTDEQFAAVQEAAQKAQEFNKEQSAQTDEDCMKSLADKGAVFTEVEDKTPYKEAVADVITENTKGIEDFYQAVVDLAK